MRSSIAARRVAWAALALLCAGAQSNVMGADLKESKGMPQNLPADFNTMRPIRNPQRIEIAVGQGEGDLQGNDDKIIQAAVDYVSRLGGGTVHVLPGTYTMRNSIFLKPGITLRGSGDKTVLKKAPSVSSPVVREADWFEYCLQVADPKGFTLGCGIAVANDKADSEHDVTEVQLFTVTAIRENVLYLDRRTEKDFWMEEGAKVQTLFSILYGRNADDVTVEDIVLDGNRAENARLNDNYGGACYGIYCDRWTFRNVIARDFNGDGFSFQVCNDWHFENCQALNNADLGLHPGSGSQRPIFKSCIAKGNKEGLYWCWAACDGLAENCTLSDNIRYGTNIGHRDTDNVLRNCVIERNGKTGINFRREPGENRQGDRNRIEGCLIRDNGGAEGDCGIDIQWKTHDITIVNCRFENSRDGKQKVAIRISPEAERIKLEGNTFTGCPVEVEDQRVRAGK
jgi:hypothetical protein